MYQNYKEYGDIVVGISENQDKEIRHLYLDMYDMLIAYAYGVLKNYALAEEAVQETFRIACTKPEEFLSSANPRGWLTNTLKNVLRNTIRSRAKMNHLLVELIRSDQWKCKEEYDEIEVDVLYSNLKDDKNYQLLKKIALDQRTVLEVSSELGISVEACTKRVQRAKKSLRKKISKD